MLNIEVKKDGRYAAVIFSSDTAPYKEERFILKKTEARELSNKLNMILEEWNK